MSALERFADSSRTSRHSEKCHVWTAPSWQGKSSRLRAVQPCVRPGVVGLSRMPMALWRTHCRGHSDASTRPQLLVFSCGPLSIHQIWTFLRILPLLRLGLRDLCDQLLGDGVAEGIEVLRYRDERAGAADDV